MSVFGLTLAGGLLSLGGFTIAPPADAGTPPALPEPAGASAEVAPAPTATPSPTQPGAPVVEASSPAPEGTIAPVDLAPGPETRPKRERKPEPEGTKYTIVPEQTGPPPYYTPEQMVAFRERQGLPPKPEVAPRKARWRCLIADQTCGMTFEVQATSAYALRVRQGDVSVAGDVVQWNSARAQYDAQLNIPVSTQTLGKAKYTRFTLGPKGGLIASDNRRLWGDFGVAGRYFFNNKRWSPTLEFSTALTMSILGPGACTRPGGVCAVPRRSPVGVHADVGFGLGGFGSIVLGGQYDSPLAREDLPEQFRLASAGMFYIGFRGNILWGAPAAAALGAHAAATRLVTAP